MSETLPPPLRLTTNDGLRLVGTEIDPETSFIIFCAECRSLLATTHAVGIHATALINLVLANHNRDFVDTNERGEIIRLHDPDVIRYLQEGQSYLVSQPSTSPLKTFSDPKASLTKI